MFKLEWKIDYLTSSQPPLSDVHADPVADPGGGGPGSPLFLDQTEARRAEKRKFHTGLSPYLKVWMTGPPPYLTVWIRH